MKINSDIALNEADDITLRYGLKILCDFHRRYHLTNSCDELVSLAFDIGNELGYYSLMLASLDKNTRERIYCLFFYLRNMCERKSFKIYNQ